MFRNSFVPMTRKIWLVFLLVVACGSKNNSPQPTPPANTDPPQYGIPYAGVPSTDDIVMYEVNIRAFSNGANFQGVIDRLDNIKALGVNTIWLMPIFPVGQLKSAGGLGSPYSVKDYKAVNPEFGDLTKFRELVDKAHGKNMAVILDWVANHTSWDNSWIQNKSWYTQDANGNIISPPGTTWTDVADLNYSNYDMRKAMISAMKYWVLAGNVDGFRCDAADFVPADFWKQAIQELKKIDGHNLVFLAEGANEGNFTSGFQMNYAWDFYTNLKQVYSEGKSASSIYTTHLSELNNIPSGAHKLRYTTNHDLSAWEQTPMVIFNGEQGALSASVITIFLSAVPLVYSSQEVGQTNLLSFFDHDPINWSSYQDMALQYQKIFSIYNCSETFKKGTLQFYNNDDAAVLRRILNGEDYLIIVNVRNAEKQISLDASLQNSSWTNAMDSTSLQLTTSVKLQPYNYLILKK